MLNCVFVSVHVSVRRYSTSNVCAWTDLHALLKQPLSFTSSPRAGLLDTEQPLRGHALECAERLALSLSLSVHSPLVITWPPLLSAILCTQEHTVYLSPCLLPPSISNELYASIVSFCLQDFLKCNQGMSRFLKLRKCTMNNSITIIIMYYYKNSYPVFFKLPEAYKYAVHCMCMSTESVCAKHTYSKPMILPCTADTQVTALTT